MVGVGKLADSFRVKIEEASGLMTLQVVRSLVDRGVPMGQVMTRALELRAVLVRALILVQTHAAALAWLLAAQAQP